MSELAKALFHKGNKLEEKLIDAVENGHLPVVKYLVEQENK
ncbi:MAG: hypothetical protein ACTSR1_00145 [Candidatus Heimdallarchaeota archaeon]